MARHRNFWQLTEDGLVYACKSLGLELTPERQQRLMDAYLSLDTFPDVKPGLETLKQQGVRLAVLSNGEPDMVRTAARHAGVLPLLDAIISAEEVGTFKPSPLVYQLASARMSVSAGEIGFVSANSWDIAGAGSAGLTTFWVQRARTETGEELGFPANHVVRAITDLPVIVSQTP
jgi:2-haloacid dehalogenase